ncbi:MAG: putative bifunctional diguanylate cyclase/phosphodiesterase, partial [Candidatus Izemoplasmatales bacterium]
DELRMEAMKELMRDHQNEPATDELYLPDLDRWYMIEKNPAEKSFGQDACMMTLTDITENKKNADILARMAFYDVLSKLPNRSRFELDVKHMYELSPATFGNAFVGILNIDNFKMLNNTFSYSYGDAVIREIAKKLTGIPELKGRVYRFGGDEFSFIVENSFGEHVYELCSKVMQIFEKPFYVEGYESYVTVSLGIGFLSDTDRDTDDLIRKTNLSLSEAKASGKNKFVLYDVSLRKYEEDNVYLERSLKIAVEHDCAEFEVYFQPIVDAKSNRVVAAEALVRWFSADLGFVPPVKFIPIAESTGLIIPLGKHILKQACKEARKWIDNGFDIQVSVNFSVIQTLQSDLVSTIMSALHTYRVPPKNLMVEITESLAIKDMKKVIDILSSIRQIGVKIAMDDFGTGYSSLSHLRKLPLDYVKIDRSFAFNLEYDPYYFSFIETITQFCHLNNTLVCVEGVENDNQRRLLQTSSVDNLQGYLFGHPASAGDFFRILVHTNN